MNNEERQTILNKLNVKQRELYREILQDAHGKLKARDGRRRSFKEVIASGEVSVPAELRPAIDAVCERDAMGPQLDQPAVDFRLKRLAKDEYVQLSAFKGQRPVALIFGSYT